MDEAQQQPRASLRNIVTEAIRYWEPRCLIYLGITFLGLTACCNCFADLPQSGETTYREWNWSQASIPSFRWPENVPIKNGNGWNTGVEYCDQSQISVSNKYLREPGSNSIRLFIDSQKGLPPAAIAQKRSGSNFRSEIYLAPWHDKIPLKTEYWLGWSYYMPPSYKPDLTSEMTIFQGHVGMHGPPVEIFIPPHDTKIWLLTHHGVYGDGNNQEFKRRCNTGISLESNKWYDFVIHILWDVESGGSGLTELWINGSKSVIKGGNVFDSDPNDSDVPYCGTPKLGIYKSPWREADNVRLSNDSGVTELELYVGTVRFLMNTGKYVGSGSYDKVAPRGVRPVN